MSHKNSNKNSNKELIFNTNKCYVKYFFHRDGKMWHCLAHLHLGNDNDVAFHATSSKKKDAKNHVKNHIRLQTTSLKKAISKNIM